jgi:hypothetical protein
MIYFPSQWIWYRKICCQKSKLKVETTTQMVSTFFRGFLMKMLMFLEKYIVIINDFTTMQVRQSQKSIFNKSRRLLVSNNVVSCQYSPVVVYEIIDLIHILAKI